MTRRRRVSSFPPEISGSSASEAQKWKHHHRRTAPQEKIYYDDDDGEASASTSPYEVEDEDEQVMDNVNSTYTESETVTNTPRYRFPSPESESIPESNDVEAETSVNSTSNSCNIRIPTTTPTTNAAYVNIAPLPIFNGSPDECPVTHLSRFTKVCRANNASSIDMMMRIFPVTLDKDASLWYDLNIEPYPSLTWEEIKSSFLQFYRRVELVDQFRSELMTIKQRDSESVRDYFLRMQWILRKWPDHGIPDSLLKGMFIDGLREDFQDWIIPQKPYSLSEALRLAFTWEQAQSIRASRHKKNAEESLQDSSFCGFCDAAHDERRCEIRERMRELWLKSKEKQLAVSSPAYVGDGMPRKDLVRSVSAVTGNVGRCQGGEAKKDEGELLGWKNKSQCQCWKHQCWMKKFESNSLVVRNSTAD